MLPSNSCCARESNDPDWAGAVSKGGGGRGQAWVGTSSETGSLAAAYDASSNCCSSCSSGRNPNTAIGCWPGRKKAIVGMLMIRKACERRGFASTSTLTTSMEPSYFSASFTISGATILQGPHHAAQKSTTTGRSDLRTISSKVASVTCLISAMERGPFSASTGEGLDEVICLEDALVREAIEDGAAFAACRDKARAAEYRQVLAHVGDLATDGRRQLADRLFAGGKRFEDALADPKRLCVLE